MTGHLIGLYIFGSVARGEHDARSDLDLLAVVADRSGKVSKAEVLEMVPPAMRDWEISISWYGRERLKQMFRNGELFAWHLHAETIPLFEREKFIASLGMPAHYSSTSEDIASFQKIMSAIPNQVSDAPQNAMYEMGLLYICLRNISMSASSILCDRPDFSRYSPFNLRDFPPIPIRRSEYELAMTCRMAGQRGLIPPSVVEPAQLLNMHNRLEPWVAALARHLENTR